MKKKKTVKRNGERGLMNSWVFNLANQLMDETDMTRSESMKQAYLVRELLEKLGQGVVTFEYEKMDGSLREARGTLCPRLMPQQETDGKTDGKQRDRDRMDFAYWDWDKQSFRAFRAGSVVRICALTIPNYREDNE